MHYYRFHIGDYAKDTAHLTPIEDLAYRRLLDWYYLNEKPIEQKSIVRLIRMVGHEDSVWQVLDEFFESTENGYIHQRADAEIIAFFKYGESKRNAANVRWQSTSNADAMHVHSSSNAINHKPETINHKPVTKLKPTVASLPDWIRPELWEAFKKYRGSKFTAYAQELAIKKLEKFKDQGQDPNKLIEESIANGWTGIYAEKQNGAKGNGYISAKDAERKRVIKGLTGYDADAIPGVSTRLD